MANDLAALPFIQPGRYRHYKGGEYEVLGVVRHSESLEPLVLYRPLYDNSGSWVRPFAMFLEPVEHDGRNQPRFSLVTAGASVSEEELAATVQRMEVKLSADESAPVAQLMLLYRQLAVRFEQDLAGCERDLSLAKASALMLVQAAAQTPTSNLGHQVRSAAPEDAVTIAALAVQVFLDTYATEGVRPDLAREAFVEYSAEAFSVRLRDPTRRFFLAEQAAGLLGFAEIAVSPLPAPAGAVVGAELVRLYVQPKAQRLGVGRRLLHEAECAAAAASNRSLWLTAWEGNHRARGFYASQGFHDVGATTYVFQGNSYGNRVFIKQLGPASSAA